MIEVTRQHLDDPNIEATDSCAVPDHPIMSRLWSERREMGTMVVGLAPDTDRLVRQAAGQIHLNRETRNLARILRRRIKGLIGQALSAPGAGQPGSDRASRRAAIAKNAPDHLAGGRQRHRIDKFDLARIFVRGKAVRAPTG